MADRLEFRIHGMDCADEVAVLRRALEPVVQSQEQVSFDILRGKMTVAGVNGSDADRILRAVAATGMRAELWRDVQRQAAEASVWQRRGRTLLTAASGLSALGAYVVQAARVGWLRALAPDEALLSPWAIGLCAGAIVSGGWYVARRAWMAIRQRTADMNLLMTIAVVGAVGIGQWFEAATVTFLFALSLTLESWSVGRARRAVEALLEIAPATAHLIQPDGTTREIPAADVPIGAGILVRPGDRIPLDGTVLRGSSLVDQAPITGESVPVEKRAGSEVFAGTVNGDGVLRVEVTRLAGETTLAQIIRMVGDAQSRRAPSEQWVDRFARIYTPAILLAAVLCATVPPLAGGSPSAWFYQSLVLLVIGCPCALVISTPVTIVAALASAARHGVLVKGGSFIEAPAALKAIALDKTGTLTVGHPAVVEVVPFSGHSELELLRALGSIEAAADHPIARAIAAYVRGRGIAFEPADDVRVVQGRGIAGRLRGRQYWAGSHRYLVELGQETPEVRTEIERRSSAGRTVVIMGTDDHVCGFVTMADAVRPESAAAIRALHNAGVRRIVMLTGDNRPTAERIARETGIDDVRAELLPADKVDAVEALVREYQSVAMIGDGVNDAPAMGRATIGVAMAASGSDTALEAADVALMSDDLGRLPWLIRHSRRALTVIRQNVVLSLAVKALFVVLAMIGHASLWGAIAADMGVSLLVIGNALRLLGPRG